MNDFPAMIFHAVFGTRIVTTREELEKYLTDGWNTKPVETVKEIKEKIAYYEAEIYKLSLELEKYEPPKEVELGEEIEPGDFKPLNDVSEPDKVKELRKRGRPRRI